MRRILKTAAVCLPALTMTQPLLGQTGSAPMPPVGTPLVFVNTAAILPVAPGADSAQSAFQAELQTYSAELSRLETELDSLVASYRRQESLLDQSARDQKQQEILDKQQAAQNRQRELEQQSSRRRDQLLAPILQNITDTIESLRAEREYSIVFDIAESGVVAADSSLDITAAVLERLGIDPALATADPDPGQ